MTRGKINILVVDDDISHCTILQALLRGWGYEVALAYSGQAALEQVRERVFDLVLCDERMASRWILIACRRRWKRRWRIRGKRALNCRQGRLRSLA